MGKILSELESVVCTRKNNLARRVIICHSKFCGMIDHSLSHQRRLTALSRYQHCYCCFNCGQQHTSHVNVV